jgi:phospholipase/carboxylesterase
MSTETETELWIHPPWTFRVRAPQASAEPRPVLLLFHGWTGNENSMWIFARRIARTAWKVAPRGLVSAPAGGFGWQPAGQDAPLALSDYQKVVDQLLEGIDRWSSEQQIDASCLDVMGFSQGAVMAYALGLLHPERVRLTGALAGYLPARWMAEAPLERVKNKRYYIAHGTQDDTIPVELGREASSQLEAAGARVAYCEAPVGHKLSANCLNGLEEFFNQAALPSAN